MEVRAVTRSIRISPRKMRLVADVVRNLPIEDAYRVLAVQEKRAALTVSKTLKSAVANAVVNANLDSKNLFVSSIMVNEAQALKRFRPSTRGRIHPYKKRGSHLTIVLKEKVVASNAIANKAKSATSDVANAKTASAQADAAVETAMSGKEEKKQGGVKGLAARLTGRKAKTEKKEEKK